MSGQQHGSVYWKRGSRNVLNSLVASKSLKEQLENCFSTPCLRLVGRLLISLSDLDGFEYRSRVSAPGGDARRSNESGGSHWIAVRSFRLLLIGRAYERFTGNQIARFAKNQPAEYENTERISLVSSFVTSLLRGDYAPIDFSDGCGMNLLNIHTHSW